MELSAVEARVLACLVEKERTVPDSYPMTVNSLRLACNQTQNRYPAVAYDDHSIESALTSLKAMGLARFVHPSHGGRTTKFRHVADERWGLDAAGLAVLSVLILRGPQTVGELRGRTERQHPFAELDEVESTLEALATRSPDAFAVRLERRPGEKDPRWAHLLSGEPSHDVGPVDMVSQRAVPGGPGLVERVAALEHRLGRLEAALGLDTEPPDPQPDRHADG